MTRLRKPVHEFKQFNKLQTHHDICFVIANPLIKSGSKNILMFNIVFKSLKPLTELLKKLIFLLRTFDPMLFIVALSGDGLQTVQVDQIEKYRIEKYQIACQSARFDSWRWQSYGDNLTHCKIIQCGYNVILRFKVNKSRFSRCLVGCLSRLLYYHSSLFISIFFSFAILLFIPASKFSSAD